MRDHREGGGLVPYDLSVDGELQAPRAGLHPDLLRPGEEDSFFVQVVRVGQNRGGELEYLQYSDVFYDHEIQEPILRVGPRGREPTASGVTAVADRQADRAMLALVAIQRQRDLLCLVLPGYLERGPQIGQFPPLFFISASAAPETSGWLGPTARCG